MTAMTLNLEPSLVQSLNSLAKRLEDNPNHLVSEAIRHFIDLNNWQLNEIEAAIVEADAEDFADDKTVESVFNKWK